MLTAGPDGRRRFAAVLAQMAAVSPPGIDPTGFARACLADTYDVVADLVGVDSGIVGPPAAAELLWPEARLLQPLGTLAGVVGQVPAYDEVVLVPGDVPDLPELVVAKVFRALQRADACVAPARNGGWVALGLRLPLAAWWPLDLDPVRDPGNDPTSALTRLAPRPGLVRVAPSWHRLNSPEAVHRLDPGLEGWERVRALLSGHPLM